MVPFRPYIPFFRVLVETVSCPGPEGGEVEHEPVTNMGLSPYSKSHIDIYNFLINDCIFCHLLNTF
jgi:hypothetical protein